VPESDFQHQIASCRRSVSFSRNMDRACRSSIQGVVTVATAIAPMMPILSLVMAISFKPIKDVAVAAVAPEKAARKTLAPNPAGAAVTASVASAVPSAAADRVTPRCWRADRSLSRPRIPATRNTRNRQAVLVWIRSVTCRINSYPRSKRIRSGGFGFFSCFCSGNSLNMMLFPWQMRS